MSTRYIIGIDLGTTNCTLAYSQANIEEPQIQQFQIPQVTLSGSQGEEPFLPSFVYFPLPEELKSGCTQLEWAPKQDYCEGVFARDRGAEIPSRLIASAKSWLCHSGIDRRAKILPISTEAEMEKMSPLEACSAFLRHLADAWSYKMVDAPFNQQQILITVPASFDPSARQLVQEAAEKANYPVSILIEEPQAAFYAWLDAHQNDWRKILHVGDVVLVVDIGGGTTDFSLISVAEEEGNLVLNRQAVGAHLLLGGDNIDLGLAYLAKQRLEEAGHSIDDWQLQSLIHAARNAKEKLLTDDSLKSIDVTIMGRGSRLIGGALKTAITQEDARSLIIEGFVPLIAPEERSHVERRSGIQQVGLPYVQDPRISAQLAKFLSMTGETESNRIDDFIVPTFVLFNGGTMKAKALRERILEQLNQWAKVLKKPVVKELPDPNFDYAVSRGAVHYGLSRTGKAIRIKSGTSRSYYIGVEDAVPAVPGLMPALKAVCVVPFGLEEGSTLVLDNQEFALVLGDTAQFRFFSHSTPKLSNGVEPQIGAVIRNWKQELTELHPIEAKLDRKDGDGKTICVTLQSHVTELGVLELWCVAKDGRKWKLEFDIR